MTPENSGESVDEMLTRYLYDCEEVCYALIYCLYKGRKKEAVFWAQELILSKEDSMLDRTIVRAWLLFLGCKRIDWLDAWFNGLDRLLLIQEFSTLIIRGRNSSPYKTFIISSRGFGEKDLEKVQKAVLENDPFSFYWYSGNQYEKSPTALLEFVKEFVDDTSLFDSLEWASKLFPGILLKTLISTAAVQLLCLKSYPESYNFTSTDICLDTKINSGIKANRLYKITDDMLPCIKRETQTEALCKNHLDIMLSGTKFWKEQTVKIVDDSTLESIVDELFPDDTPYEWSLKDRSFSHPVTFKKYKIFIKTEYRSSLLWGFRPALRKAWAKKIDGFLKGCYAPEC